MYPVCIVHERAPIHTHTLPCKIRYTYPPTQCHHTGVGAHVHIIWLLRVSIALLCRPTHDAATHRTINTQGLGWGSCLAKLTFLSALSSTFLVLA